MEWRRTSFIIQNLLEDQNGATEKFGPSPPNSAKIWTGENCETDSQNNSRDLSDAARQCCVPHAYVQIKTGCIMPDSSGAAKENWGKKISK